jgi:hypothetical protein
MEFYSAVRKNNILWLEGKWMQLDNIMLSEISLVQKDKKHMFSFRCGRQIQKISSIIFLKNLGSQIIPS